MKPLGVLLVLYTPIALLRGFVIATLWGWYVVPLGAPTLSLVNAVGLSILAYLVTDRPSTQEERDELRTTAGVISRVMRAAMAALLALLFGWLWTLAT